MDERTDIYSVGVMLYELVTTKLPFRAGSIESTFEMILHDKAPLPSKRLTSRSVPAEIDPIIMKSIEKEPRKRYQSMLEFEAELREFLLSRA